MDTSIQSGSRARLLVIEDADDTREMLKFLLEIKGYVVDTAPDGYEGSPWPGRVRPLWR